MAEDKKIKVSADLSQLRALREEITGIFREVNALSNVPGNEAALAKLKEQLELLGERNSLEELFGEIQKKNAQIPSETPPQNSNPLRPNQSPSNETSQNIEREILEETPSKKRGRKKKSSREEIDVPEEELEQNLPIIPDWTPEENQPTHNIEREIPEEDSRDIERETPLELFGTVEEETPKKKGRKKKSSREETETPEEPEERVLLPRPDWIPEEHETPHNIEREIPEEEPRSIEREIPPEELLGESKEEVVKEPQKKKASKEERSSLSEDRKNGIDILAFLEKWKASLAQTDAMRNEDLSEINSYLKDIWSDVSSIAENFEDSTGAVPPTAEKPESASGDDDKKKKEKKEKKEPLDKTDIAIASVGAQAILKVLDKFQEAFQIIATRHLRTLAIGEQKEYMDPLSSVSNYTSYQGAQKADPYRWIPFLGGIAATEIETIANAKAQKQGIGLRVAGQMESQVRPYSQTFDVSNSKAASIAFQEGGYAAGALGMTAGQYSGKRTELVRAGGGVDRVSGVRESQSLMAAERLYGLAPQSTANLQGSMRFSEKDGTSTNSSSAVIRVFEQTMRELKKPFSEIASTIEESLTTFNRSAQSILDKTGDFDAAKIAGVLAGIRAYTGAEGKQLERYQESFSGQVISQDEVTQALLLRTITKMDSSIKTYSDALSKIEKIQEDPEIMRSFLKELQSLTTTNEQFVNVLSAVFPKLSVSDIKEQVEKPGFNIDALFDKIMASTKSMQKESDKKNQYERDAAAKTVGTIESANASYQDKMSGYGLSISGDISKIRAELEKIKEKPEAKNIIDSAVNSFADTLIKASESMLPKKGATRTDPSFWTTVPGLLIGMMGMQMKQMFREEE